VAVTLAVAALYLWDPALLEVVELKSYDLRQRALTTRAPSGDVSIVAIDEQSLSQLGRWPWPRTTLARLIEALDRAGARVVAFDVFFPESDAARSAGSSADDKLARAISASGKVVLSLSFLMSADEVRHVSGTDARQTLASVARDALPGSSTGVRAALALPEPVGLLANVPPLQRAARYSGHINIFPDRDGTLRAMPLVMAYRENLFPAADVQAARLFLGDVPLGLEADDG
jgi:adenylate cyclase